MIRNIILCGFMGCGKTTVGGLLADMTGRRFVDMDSFIEKHSGMPVSQIFSEYGEEAFRMRERQACIQLASQEGLVIAAGGGALTFQVNADVLSKSGDIVFLDVPLDVILKRLETDTSRPLLTGPDREKASYQLYNRRLPLYRAAAGYVVDGNDTADRVAKRVTDALGI
ncbi:MAG TPA: shikimate kinase [Ruminococcaceae bacterium]|nr:shikimate kinase [Oscillospiraceae bacterium]